MDDLKRIAKAMTDTQPESTPLAIYPWEVDHLRSIGGLPPRFITIARKVRTSRDDDAKPPT